MKPDIHPTYFLEAQIHCACGNSWITGSVLEEIRVDICSECHPFYTGEQRIVDTEGQVDRFYKRLEVRQQFVDDKADADAAKVSPERLITEFEVSKRTIEALKKVEITNVGHFMKKLAKGDTAVLAIEGIGRKSLADMKKGLRRFGYELPEDAVKAEAE